MEILPLLRTPPAEPSISDLTAFELHKVSLRTLIEQAVNGLTGFRIKPVVSLNHGQVIPGPEMMTLLTYSFAIGLQSSEAIEDLVDEDPVIHALWALNHPDRVSIHRFCKQNRRAIRNSLTETCRSFLKLRLISMDWLSRAEWPRARPCPQQLDLATEQDIQREVHEALELAKAFDGLKDPTRRL